MPKRIPEDKPVGTTRIKCVVLGDEDSNKSRLLHAYVFKEPEVTSTTPPFRHEKLGVYVGHKEKQLVELTLINTPGAPVQITPVLYLEATVFVILFAIDNRESFHNVKSVWAHELSKRGKRKMPVPVVLVGHGLEKRGNGSTSVSFQEGLDMCADIGAIQYLECSSTSLDGVTAALDAAVKAAFVVLHPSTEPAGLQVGFSKDSTAPTTEEAGDSPAAAGRKGKRKDDAASSIQLPLGLSEAFRPCRRDGGDSNGDAPSGQAGSSAPAANGANTSYDDSDVRSLKMQVERLTSLIAADAEKQKEELSTMAADASVLDGEMVLLRTELRNSIMALSINGQSSSEFSDTIKQLQSIQAELLDQESNGRLERLDGEKEVRALTDQVAKCRAVNALLESYLSPAARISANTGLTDELLAESVEKHRLIIQAQTGGASPHYKSIHEHTMALADIVRDVSALAPEEASQTQAVELLLEDINLRISLNNYESGEASAASFLQKLREDLPHTHIPDLPAQHRFFTPPWAGSGGGGGGDGSTTSLTDRVCGSRDGTTTAAAATATTTTGATATATAGAAGAGAGATTGAGGGAGVNGAEEDNRMCGGDSRAAASVSSSSSSSPEPAEAQAESGQPKSLWQRLLAW